MLEVLFLYELSITKKDKSSTETEQQEMAPYGSVLFLLQLKNFHMKKTERKKPLTFQSREGSFTNTSIVLMRRSGSARYALRACTITL